MRGRQAGDQSQPFYLFNLERRIPAGHLLRRLNPILARVLGDLRDKLAPYYSEIGRPSIDPELMIRMLIGGRFHRALAENTAQETVGPDPVVDEMRPAILAFRGAKRTHAPDVRIGVDAVQCAVEKNREAHLLLLCACKVWLAADSWRFFPNSDRF